MTLAIDSYRRLGALHDGGGVLNLAWTSDEREFLGCDLTALVTACLEREVADGLPWTGRYGVQDPYGAGVVGPAVERFFGVAGLAADVSCGAGVNALLHGLASAWTGGTVALAAGIYPDFPHWLERLGVRAAVLPADGAAVPWLERQGPVSLVYIERPAFAGTAWDGLEAVRGLCACAARLGAVVLADESNANYCPPSYSAVALTREVANLAVLRGFSKAYGLGGIRVGFCVSSPALTTAVRAALPSLQAGSLSLLIARTVLEAGDLTAPLRRRIAAMKARALDRLTAAGVGAASLSPVLPYVVLPDAVTLLWENPRVGIITKRHPRWMGTGGAGWVQRCSVPLDAGRMAAFEDHLATVRPGAPDRRFRKGAGLRDLPPSSHHPMEQR